MVENTEYVPFMIFFDSLTNPISKPATTQSFKCPPSLDTITLEVKGCSAINLTVQGCVNVYDSNKNEVSDAECEWNNLVTIKSDNLKLSDVITEKGIYYINVPGINRVRLVLASITGAATITGTGVR